MTRPLNALVLGVGGNVSQSIQKALALASVPTRVIAACISPDSAGLYVADRAYISPLARESGFIPWLLEVCQREQIDAVLSGSEIVLEVLAPQAQAVRERTGAVCIVSSPEALATGRDKLRTCRWLEHAGLPVPGYAPLADVAAVDALLERCGFPLVAKPRFGKSGDGILTLHDEHDLERVLAAEDLSLRAVIGAPVSAEDLLVQEYLGDPLHEYTAGCFCDRAGALHGSIVLRRSLQAGTTVRAEPGEFPDVAEVAGAIATALAPLGPCNVQLRIRDGRPVPFEINPRFSGTTALRARLGFNEVEASLRHFVLGEPVPRLASSERRVAVRYWNEIYLRPEAVKQMADSGRLDGPGAHRVETEDWAAGG
ncbi:MAG: ATP-grasp domain-containing protein [Solirubrobacterales bacterium]|nr:ATP-grasp domain-containing protein [Solirubrobacterales bacterium]